MANFDFKAATPDTSFPVGAFLFGADSQAAATPSIYGQATVWDYWKTLANTWSAAQQFNSGIVVDGSSVTMQGNISAATWSTSGLRYKSVAATLTDTSGAGTVAAAYTNAYGGNTIAATNARTFTNYYTTFINAPTAGTNVSFTNRWALGLGGGLAITGNSALSQPMALLNGTWITGGTATTNKPHFLIEPAGTTSTGWVGSAGTAFGINGPSGFTGNLIDLQVAGVYKLRINYEGYITALDASATVRLPIARLGGFGADYKFNLFQPGGSTVQFCTGTTAAFQIVNGAAGIESIGSIGISASAGNGASVLLYRDGADNTLALRNSTNAQTFRTYGTFTDTGNYRRVSLTMTTAGVASLTAEGSGTGASGNVLHISSLPTSNPGPGILWNNAGTPAIGT